MAEAVHKFTNLQLTDLLKDQNPKVIKFINFEAEPKSSRYSLSLLHVFTNPVERHDFGAPLKHKSGIDSWILLHLDEMERRCKLTLYPGWLKRVEIASVYVHRCTHVV